MNWTYYIIGWVCHIILMVYLFGGNKEENLKIQNGRHELRQSKSHLRAGMFGFILSPFLLIIAIVENQSNVWLTVIMLVAIFGPLASILLLKYYNHSVVFDHEKIEVINVWKRKRTIYFKDVIDAHFYKSRGYLLVKSNDTQVKIDAALGGINLLVKQINKKAKLHISKINQSNYR